MAPAKQIRVRNWERYQHYTDRRPPWIKLHVELLDKHDTMSLPVASRWLAVSLLLVAARSDNVIAVDVPWLSRVANMSPTQTQRGLNDLLRLRFVEPIGRKRGASKVLDESLPSRARTRSASASVSEELPGAQELVAYFVDLFRENGDVLPDRVKGQTAREIGKLVKEGVELPLIRRALHLLADKGKHPSVLASLVVEVQREGRGNGARFVPTAEILGLENVH